MVLQLTDILKYVLKGLQKRLLKKIKYIFN